MTQSAADCLLFHGKDGKLNIMQIAAVGGEVLGKSAPEKGKSKMRIFRFINQRERTSKQEIVFQLGISLPTVLQSLKELMAEGLVWEMGEFESTGGKLSLFFQKVEQKDETCARAWEEYRKDLAAAANNLFMAFDRDVILAAMWEAIWGSGWILYGKWRRSAIPLMTAGTICRPAVTGWRLQPLGRLCSVWSGLWKTY